MDPWALRPREKKEKRKKRYKIKTNKHLTLSYKNTYLCKVDWKEFSLNGSVISQLINSFDVSTQIFNIRKNSLASKLIKFTGILSVKYQYIEFFVFDYDSLPISFQSGITFSLVALDKIHMFICNTAVIIITIGKLERVNFQILLKWVISLKLFYFNC